MGDAARELGTAAAALPPCTEPSWVGRDKPRDVRGIDLPAHFKRQGIYPRNRHQRGLLAQMCLDARSPAYESGRLGFACARQETYATLIERSKRTVYSYTRDFVSDGLVYVIDRQGTHRYEINWAALGLALESSRELAAKAASRTGKSCQSFSLTNSHSAAAAEPSQPAAPIEQPTPTVEPAAAALDLDPPAALPPASQPASAQTLPPRAEPRDDGHAQGAAHFLSPHSRVERLGSALGTLDLAPDSAPAWLAEVQTRWRFDARGIADSERPTPEQLADALAELCARDKAPDNPGGLFRYLLREAKRGAIDAERAYAKLAQRAATVAADRDQHRQRLRGIEARARAIQAAHDRRMVPRERSSQRPPPAPNAESADFFSSIAACLAGSLPRDPLTGETTAERLHRQLAKREEMARVHAQRAIRNRIPGAMRLVQTTPAESPPHDLSRL